MREVSIDDLDEIEDLAIVLMGACDDKDEEFLRETVRRSAKALLDLVKDLRQ